MHCIVQDSLSAVKSVEMVLHPTCHVSSNQETKEMRDLLNPGWQTTRMGLASEERRGRASGIDSLVPSVIHIRAVQRDKGINDHKFNPGVFGAILPVHHTIRDQFIWAKEGTW